MSDRQKKFLVTGPSSSGKSEFAEILATKTNKSVIYIATAQINHQDREWQARILKHQQRRPADWQSINVPRELPTQIDQADPSQCLLIDSLGTWVANFMESDTAAWKQISDRLLSSLQTTPGVVILVGEETGWGIVPAYEMGRLFRDRLGSLSRHIGNIVDTTYLVVGGHVLNLTTLGEPLSKYEI